MNTKSNLLKSIFISLILAMGVNNAWADTAIRFSGGYIYFADIHNVHKGVTQLAARKSNCSNGDWYTAVTTLSNIENTKLYYTNTLEGSVWQNVCWNGWCLISNSSAKSNTGDELWNKNKSTWWSSYDSYDLDNNSTYVITVASNSQGAQKTTKYKGKGVEDLNFQQTIKTAVDGDDANSKASISITSYKMTGNGQVTKQTATLGTDAKDSHITAALTAKTTLTVDTVATGYQFDGWYAAKTGGTALSTEYTYTYYPTEATTVYARFSANQYTITYNLNDGSGTMTPTTYTVETETFNLPIPTKAGCTFEGWYTTSNFSGSKVTQITKGSTGDKTFYAKWTQITVSATITPTDGTTGTNNLTFSITSNVPTNSEYYVGVYNFGDNDYASGYINGDKKFTSNPTSYTATYNQNTAGTYYTRAFVMKDSKILATSEKIAFTVNAGSSASTVSEWKMYNGDTELGTFTNEGNDTYTLTITIPEGGYNLTNYRNNLGNIGTPGASSLLNNEQQLTINNGRLSWKDGAGTFTITIRKDGETWKISAIKQSTNKNIYLVGQFNKWTDNDNNYKFEETEPGIYTLTKHFDKRERYNATDASQAEWEFKLLVDGTKYTVEGNGAAKVLQYTRQNKTKVLKDGYPYGGDPSYYNLLLQADQAGDYVFTYNANTQVLTVTHPEYSPSASYVVGDFSDGQPGTDATPKDGGAGKDWTEMYGEDITNSTEVCFPPGESWNFKIKINGIWYGAENLVISESGTYILSNEYADAGQRNYAIQTSVSGCYDFSYQEGDNEGEIKLTVTYPESKSVPVYLKLNDDWQKDDKRYAIYCWNTSGNTWVDMKKLDCDGYFYTATVPQGYNEFKFVQLGKNSGNSFDGNPKQTEDLTVPAGAANMYDMTSTKTTYLYLKPNDNWKKDNARFEANFDDGTKYVYMNDIGNGIYRCEKGNYTKVQFNRVNPNDGYNKWNKTGNLTIPTDGKNLFTLSNDSWDDATTTWSAIYDDSKWAELDEIPSFIITLDRQDGTENYESVTATYGANVENITVPEREGYTFGGYYTNTNGEGDLYISTEGEWQNVTYIVDRKWDKPVCGLTLYAKWTPKKYQITYTAPTNGNYSIQVGSNTPVSENTEADCDQTITLSATPNPGYHFVEWTVTKAGGGTISVTDNKFTMPAEDVTVAATFEPNIYTITYKDQGGETFSGTHEDGSPTQHTYDSDTQLKGAGKMGCTFLGWFTDNECTEGPISILGATAYTADITLYAKWDTRNLYIHADFVNWEGIPVEPEFKNNSVVYTYIGILEEDASSFNEEHKIWDGGHHFHYLYSLEGIEKPETQKIAYNYYNVDAGNISYTQSLIDEVHLTDDNNPTIQFGLTKKSKVTITLTLRSDIETDDKATQPDVAIVAIPYNTITLDQTGARTQGTVTSVEVPNGDPMPAITGDGALPTPQIGYTFMGYFNQKDGKGTQYYNTNGTSEYTWDKTEDATLYAYFQPAKITNITLDKEVFEPVTSGEAYVTATPTIDPNDIEGVAICWRLLYSNGDEVTEHKAIDAGDNKVKFSIVGLATGTYTIEATLHATACGNGEPLSTLTKNFIIASEYTVTVKYTCDNQEIKASTTAPAHATDPETLEASDIFGYTFKEWVAGDGVEIKTTSGDGKTITYTATYNGTITAKYTKKKLIYLDLSQKFSESGKWSDPYIYLYGSDGYWDNEKGAGATGDACKAKGAMTKIEGTDIWYYDYSNVAGFTKYLAFTWGDSRDKANFDFGDVIYRGDFSEGTPLFVPATDQTKEEKNGAKYYSKGYWVNYIGEHTGYTLIIYNEAGDKELIRQKFTSANKRMNMTSAIDLEAEHKYQYEVLRDHGYYYKYNSSQLTYSNKGPKPLNTANKGTIITTAAGDYTFTLGYWSGDLQISVDYPAAVGDYRILYRDNGTTNWSGNPRPNNWCHPSRIIKKKEGAIDTISFFVNTKKEPQLLYQTIQSINASTGAITWNAAKKFEDVKWNVIEKDGVINFTFTQSKGAIAVTNIELYKGNYYIRVDAVDGQWGHYKTNADNRMTYSAFSEKRETNSFGELFSHYKTKWCPRGTNVKFTIANDYSPCITDTLIRDIEKTWEENMDEHGKLKSDESKDPTADKYSANIRFMWNDSTNKISRAYLSSATNVTKKFLILQGDDKMKNAEGKEIAATEHVPADATLLDDKQNWIYETTIKVQPGARVKLYACYATPEGQNDIATAQYFRGTNAAFSESSTVQILGGTGETWNTMRVIYDFKTNRLMGAWVPDTEIGDNGLQIDADIMIMREHQEEATCINLTENANSKLTDVKTVYGVMRFNRWILNNRANPKDLDVDHCSTFDGNDRNYDEEKVKEHHPVLPLIEQKSQYERALYFISFPFDVNVSDIFGFGTYGQHWIIEYYDGLKRAREGYWIDSDPNWKYVTNPDEFVLEKYKGYILCLNLGKMAYNNTDFWAHNISQVELFFPSTTTMSEISQTKVTMPSLDEEYLCKINRGDGTEGDRRVKDSYWRCIGVPSYANYSNVLTDGNQQTINWQTSYTTFPFLYAWNMTDNTLTPQSTTNFKFKTMHAYLVQNGGEIHWSAVSATPNQPSNIVARKEAPSNNYEWKITLTRNEQVEDQAFIRLSNDEKITNNFDFNQDLSKEFNYGRSDIYTLIGYEKAAANSLPISEQTTVIPLGLSIEYNGDYTIAMPGRMENIGVTLIDTESNTRTNLSAGMDYTLTLNKGDYNNRFFIEISPVQQVPTDIEYVTGDTNGKDNVRKVLIDNILYIVRDGQMFDARGARVK